MRQRFPKIISLLILLFCITFGTMAAFMQTTYTEDQLRQAGQKYLIQLGEEYEDCSLQQKRWYNDQLFCLYQNEGTLFVIGFSKNEWFPKRLSPRYFYYPKEQLAGDSSDLFSFSEKKQECYTYVIFGQRPEGVRGIEVDVVDKQQILKSQYCYSIDEQEKYVFYILQKLGDDSLSFQYRLYS